MAAAHRRQATVGRSHARSRRSKTNPTRAESMRGALAPHLGRAHVVGITGPAGAGKSTLVNALVGELLRRGHTVGGRRDRSVESI